MAPWIRAVACDQAAAQANNETNATLKTIFTWTLPPANFGAILTLTPEPVNEKSQTVLR
jgi:hypothetical protein